MRRLRGCDPGMSVREAVDVARAIQVEQIATRLSQEFEQGYPLERLTRMTVLETIARVLGEFRGPECPACEHRDHDEDPCPELVRAGEWERLCGCIE